MNIFNIARRIAERSDSWNAVEAFLVAICDEDGLELNNTAGKIAGKIIDRVNRSKEPVQTRLQVKLEIHRMERPFKVR